MALFILLSLIFQVGEILNFSHLVSQSMVGIQPRAGRADAWRLNLLLTKDLQLKAWEFSRPGGSGEHGLEIAHLG